MLPFASTRNRCVPATHLEPKFCVFESHQNVVHQAWGLGHENVLGGKGARGTVLRTNNTAAHDSVTAPIQPSAWSCLVSY